MSHFYGFINVGGRRFAQWQIVMATLAGYYGIVKYVGYRGRAKPIPDPVYEPEQKAFIEEYIRAVAEERSVPKFIREL
ncbi:hypothetical protein DFJ74DRAFT_764003 [Hyaloraphidium curvatum]|nr:hypothetical protein DFJ74DRAFT_764003 [Hyaloraphidium curvatum]